MARLHASALAIAVMLSAVACTSSDEPSPTPTQPASATAAPSAEPAEPTPTVASPSPSPSPTPSAAAFQRPDVNLTDEQQEALDTVEEFFYYYDKALKDPNQPFQRLSEIADGEYLGTMSRLIQQEAGRGVQMEGQPLYEVIEVGDISEVDGEAWTEVYVCSDVAEVWTSDSETGEVISTPSQPYQVFKLNLRHRGVWQIPQGGNRWSDTCEP